MKRALALQGSGITESLLAAQQTVLGQIGERAIALASVQELAEYASGIDPEPPPFCDPGHQSFLSLRAASGDPIGRAVAERHFDKKSYLAHIENDWFSLVVELEILEHLLLKGWEYVDTEREDGKPDWVTTRNGALLSIECKSLAAFERPREVIWSAWEGQCLLPPNGLLRDYRWFLIPTDSDNLLRSMAEYQSLDQLFLVFEGACALLSELLSAGGHTRVVSIPPGASLKATWQWGEGDPPRPCLEVENTHGSLYLQSSPGPWARDRYAGESVYMGASESEVDKAIGALKRQVKESQVRRAGGEALFVFSWPIPFRWSPEHGSPFDVESFARSATDAVSEYANKIAPGTPVAVWPRSYYSTPRQWHLNDAAKVVLGR